jgi:3-oxoacyl-[acyl-carrier protein] reductase
MVRQAAFVTGSSRDIGKGIAQALAKEGFDVAVNAEVDTPELWATVDQLRSLGVRAVACVADVSDIRAHQRVLGDVEAELGPLTTLVNNAGVNVLARGDVLDVTPESFDRCLSVNARVVFFLTQSFVRRLLSRAREPAAHCSIINISSANAIAAGTTRAEYCVSKAAVSMITKCYAARLGSEGINVYEIQPGVIETNMTRPVLQSYKQRIADGADADPPCRDACGYRVSRGRHGHRSPLVLHGSHGGGGRGLRAHIPACAWSTLGGRGAAILRAARQDCQLSNRGDTFARQSRGEPADRC